MIQVWHDPDADPGKPADPATSKMRKLDRPVYVERNFLAWLPPAALVFAALLAVAYLVWRATR